MPAECNRLTLYQLFKTRDLKWLFDELKEGKTCNKSGRNENFLKYLHNDNIRKIL
jgi:hypothetical protein